VGSSVLTRRQLLARGGAGLIGLSSASLLAACGSSSGGNAPAAVARVEAARGEVTYWYTVTNAKQKAWQQKYDFDAFSAANPEITLQTTQKPLDTIGRVTQTAVQAGKGPDVIITSGPALAAAYARAGDVIALDEYAAKYGWDRSILPWALDAGRLEGKLYSLPMSYESMILYYNKTLFADKGWSVPQSRADLEAIATDAMEQGIIPFASGNAEWKAANEWLVTAFFNHLAGPEAMQEALLGERPWTDPLFEEAVTVMTDWFRKGWFGGGVNQYFSNRFDPLYAGMADGRYAMNLEGTWAFANLSNFFTRDAEFDWTTVPSLRDGVPNGIYALGAGGTWAINAKAQAPGAAAKYLDWRFADPERIARGVADVDYQPTPVPLTRDDFPSGIDPTVERFYVDFAASTGRGVFGYTSWTFMPPRSDSYLAEEIEKVLVGRMKPAEYLEGLDRLFTTELRRNDVPPVPRQAA
jgi:raffinose/stachyose/melibiose transport system substrate-binding protein